MKPRLDGDERVQRFHRLHDEGRVYEPLGVVLQRLCSELAAILPADVVSVYLREQSAADEDLLVMRANYGFTRVAVGNVQLRVGEGITGTAAELGRVVAGEADHDRFARVEGLREERFPHFLALPILRHGDVLGVLVLLLGGCPTPNGTGYDDVPTLALLGGGDHTTDSLSITTMVAVILLPAIVEEVLYRGLLQESIRRARLFRGASPWVSIVATSVVFTAAHIGVLDLHGLVGLFVLSLGLGWAYARTGRLTACITMHMVFNAGNIAVGVLWT